MKPRRGRYHITFKCNLSCPFCLTDSGGDGTGELEPDELRPIFERIVGLGVDFFGITGGEPLLVSDRTLRAVEIFKELGVGDIRVFTNGTLATREKVQALVDAGCTGFHISVDGLRESHDSMRGEGSWAKTMAALSTVKQAGVYLRTVTLVTERTASEMGSLVKLLTPLADTVQLRNVNKTVGRGVMYEESLDLGSLEALYGGKVVLKEHGDFSALCDNISVRPDGNLMTCGQTQDILGHGLEVDIEKVVANHRGCRLRDIKTGLNAAGDPAYRRT